MPEKGRTRLYNLDNEYRIIWNCKIHRNICSRKCSGVSLRAVVSGAGNNHGIVSRSGYIWIWSEPRDQESTNHSPLFGECKSRYMTMLVIWKEKDRSHIFRARFTQNNLEKNRLLDVLACSIGEYFYSIIVFSIAIRTRQNTAKLVNILLKTASLNI